MKTPLSIATSYYQAGVIEASGKNDGKLVEHFLREKKPGDWPAGRPFHNWCAAFVLTCFEEAGYPLPGNFFKNRAVSHLASMLSLAGADIDLQDLQPGDIVTFKRDGGGHIGIVCEVKSTAFWCFEGNVANALRCVHHNWNDIKISKAYRWPA